MEISKEKANKCMEIALYMKNEIKEKCNCLENYQSNEDDLQR